VERLGAARVGAGLGLGLVPTEREVVVRVGARRAVGGEYVGRVVVGELEWI